MKENKKCKQTLESAQYGLEIVFKLIYGWLCQLMFGAYSTGSRTGIKVESFTRLRTFVTLKRQNVNQYMYVVIIMHVRQKNSVVIIVLLFNEYFTLQLIRGSHDQFGIEGEPFVHPRTFVTLKLRVTMICTWLLD